jgi:hypothetical protein
MEELYAIPTSDSVKIEAHYQGRQVDKKFCKANPELFNSFPSVEQVLKQRNEVLKNKVRGVRYTIVVFEDGIYTVET